jgi:hypothetical protein
LTIAEINPQWLEELKAGNQNDSWAQELIFKYNVGDELSYGIKTYCGIIRKK